MPPTLPLANTPLLHRFLGIGMTGIVLVFAGMMALGFGPLLTDPADGRNLIGYVMAGLSAIEAGVALFVMKRRVPERRPGESVQAFWSNTDTLNKIMVVWFMLTGAGTLAAIAFLLTGVPAAALVTVVTIAMFWMNGPSAFGK